MYGDALLRLVLQVQFVIQFHKQEQELIPECLIVVVSHVCPDTTNVPATENDMGSDCGCFCRS